MPVIVVGADTPLGTALVNALSLRGGELRAFVTDPDIGRSLQDQGVKVAVGDVSDGSHIGGAALNAFCAVLVPLAATDERERSFADTPDDVFAGWAEGLKDGGVQRAIWLDDGTDGAGVDAIARAVTEYARVDIGDRTIDDIVTDVVTLDAADQL